MTKLLLAKKLVRLFCSRFLCLGVTSEHKLSETVRLGLCFAGGNRGHYRTDFDAFCWGGSSSLGSWRLTSALVAVGDLILWRKKSYCGDSKTCPVFFVQARPEKMILIWNCLFKSFEQNPQAEVTIFGALRPYWPYVANVFYLATYAGTLYALQIEIEGWAKFGLPIVQKGPVS